MFDRCISFQEMSETVYRISGNHFRGVCDINWEYKVKQSNDTDRVSEVSRCSMGVT
jgi:hypothetical protein